ncbi:MAG: hypothetical protein QM534_14075 [Sediminibacterium sp.]|nr:hypothetical protein [Sediminibacterium sp.]
MIIKDKVDELNSYFRKFLFFELSILSYKDGNLVIAGSDDFLYYHNIEITFTELFTVVCNSLFKLNTEVNSISIVDDIQECREINIKYRVEMGNVIFKIIDEDDCIYYIIAKDLNYKIEPISYNRGII